MVDLPTAVPLVTVGAWLTQAVADTSDVGKVPDMLPMSGTITFTPNRTRVKVPNAEPRAMVLFPKPIACTLDSDGFLLGPDGTLDVTIAATGDLISSYSVQFVLDGIARFTIQHEFPAGPDIDLATALELPDKLAADITAWNLVVKRAEDAALRAETAAGIAGGDSGTVGGVLSVAGKTGDVVLAKEDVGLPAVDNTSDVDKPVSTATNAALDSSATASRARANHTGSQTSATISDFTEAVQDAVGALLGAGSNVTLNYDDLGNTLTIASTGGGTFDAEAVRDAVGIALVGVGNIGISVNDTADTITVSTTATANSTDAQLRARSSHTGTQTASTISDFATAVQVAAASIDYDAIGARGLAYQKIPIDWAATNNVKVAFTEVGIPATIDGTKYDARYDTALHAWMEKAKTAGVPFQVWGSAEWQMDLRAYASASGTSGDLAQATNVAAVLEPYLPYNPLNGVNLSGGEFGQNGQTLPTVPGTYGTDYYYPSANDIAYLAGRGIKTIRVPFRWERLQRSIGAPLDATEVTRFTSVLAAAASNGVTVIADLHNYGAYTVATGQTAVLLGAAAPTNSYGITTMNAAFVDFWTKFANQFGTHAGLGGYGLMNEPHDLAGTNGGDTWRTASSDAANAVYGITKQTKNIFVSGYFYATSSDWIAQNGNTPWLYTFPTGVTNALSEEPNVYFEAHMYFDDPDGGIYTATYATNLTRATNAGFTSGSVAGTANPTDAQLRDRATHTGAQPISTITDLQVTLDGKVEVGDTTWTGTEAEYQALAILSTDTRLYVTKAAGETSRIYLGAELVWEASGTPGSSTVVGALRVTDPTVQGANVAGDLYLEAEIAGATAVEFQVGHFDWPRYPATLVSGNLWRSNAPWKSALSVTDGVTPRPNDFAAYIRTHSTVSGVVVVGDLVEVLTLNKPDIVGVTPVWRPELEFTSNLAGTIADYYASFHTTWGTANNPDGTPPAKIINATTATGNMVNIYMPDDHTTADQPNSNLRWQMQTRPELRNGDEVWIGYSYRIPVDTALFGTPTSSHISIGQLMGADAADSYDLGLRMMYQARTKTSVSGYTDQLTDHFHISMSDGRYAEPELTFQLPFYRGEIVDMVYGFGVATTPQEGWMEIRYRIPGDTVLTRHEFFGIPGKYRIPVALIDKNGVGQRFDQHIYRGRGKFPVVSIDFGQLKIRATPEEADPKSNILTLMQESFNGATGGVAMSTTNTSADIVTTGANNTLTLDAGKFIATLGITNGSFADWLLTAPQSGRTIVRIEKFEFSVASSFRPLVFRGSSGNLGHWRVNSSGTLELLSATGVGVATTTTTMTPNTLYDVEVAISPGTTTTDGVLELRYALAGSSASIGAPLIATGVNAGATPLLRHRLGTSSPASVAVVFKVDHVSVRALTTGWIGFTSEEVAPSEPGAPQVVGTSTVAPVGNQNLTPGNSTVILAAPTGLAIGDYYFYTATISSLNATSLSFPAQPGFTVFSVDSGTTADEAIALVGRPIVNQADLDDAQLVTIEAEATTGRVVAHGVALRNIDMTSPFVGIGAFTTLSGGANDKTTIGFAAPPAGGFSVGVVSSYTSGTGGVTTYASVGGSMIVEGVATAQVDPNASSSNSLGVFTSDTTSVSTVGRSAFDITTIGITFNAAGTAPPPSGTATEGLAYDITASSANRTTKKVFGHYFPPNPISYDNDPLTSLDPTEYWRVNMTNAVPGESGKHTRWGSFSRNRPLYRDPKPSGWQVSDMKEEIRQAFTTGLDGFVINTMGLSGANWIRNTELIQACNESHPTGDFWVNIMIDVASSNMANANVDTIADRIAYFAWTDMNTPDTGAWSKSATSVLRASAHFLPDGRYLVGGYNVANKTAAWWDSIFVSLSTRYGLNGALLGAYAAASQTANYDGYSWSYGGGDWATAADPTVAANRSLSSWASIKSAGRALLCGVSSQGIRVNSVHGYKYDEFGNITGPRFYPIFDESVGLEAMIAQWENVITADADYVQLVTWNDYSEGAEFGWSTLGGSVNTDVSAYFAHWWKTGAQPDILEDVIYLSHRDQFATNPGTNQRAFLTTTGTNQEYFFGQWERGTEHPVVNVVEAVSFLTAAATVTVTVGGVVTTYTAQAGLHRQEVPLGTGTVSADVVRGGVSVASLTSPFQVLSAPIKDNPHYCKSSSKRPAITAGQFNPHTQPGAN